MRKYVGIFMGTPSSIFPHLLPRKFRKIYLAKALPITNFFEK
jgi:hypothetical protein